jgi:Retrotransposon gag protein
MNAQQFGTFMTNFTDLVTQLAAQQQPQPQAPPAQNANPPTPKFSLKIPAYRGEPKENVVVWLLQVRNLFRAQGINEDATRIYYAASGFEGAALYWYINKTQAAGNNPAFASWNDFMTQLKGAFQPPNYQQYLRQQLKQLRQTGSVHEYGVQFRSLMGQIENMEELDKVSYFIDGLKAATKMEVNYQAPANFEDAWKLAI